ncbi:MAG: hypothetical protein HDQ88_04615 [Clostridia bacterium]|nr:hypothetical protein [Clostridia bacterium]
MYNSCKEAHIAVNDKIQQINANRQESIRPQYVDIALNEAVDVLLTQKIKAFEETGRYYDDLQVLKCSVNAPLYIMEEQMDRGFAFIPANYLHGISFDARVIFDKFHRYRATKMVTDKLHIVSLKPIFDILKAIETQDDPEGALFTFNLTIGSNEYEFEYPIELYERQGIFELLNFILTKLHRFGYDVTYEYFNNLFAQHSFIFRTDAPKLTYKTQLDNEPITCKVETKTSFYDVYTGKYEVITSAGVEIEDRSGNFVGMDLVSDVQRRDILQTYHNAKNRHIHPICTIENGRLFVDMADNFIVREVCMNYLRKPTLFNFVDDSVAELPFKTEIVNVAVQKLLGKLKDDGYQVALNETNALK